MATKMQPKHTPDHTVTRSNNMLEVPPTHGRSPGHELVKRGRITHSTYTTPVVGQSLPPTALREHTLVAQVLVGMAGPMFSDKVGVVLFTITPCTVCPLFGGCL